MKDDVSLIKNRLQTVKYFYNKTEDMINKLPDNRYVRMTEVRVDNSTERILEASDDLRMI